MPNPPIGGTNTDLSLVTELKRRFQQASSTTVEGRAARDQVLDELQEAVGMGGRMVTEGDIIRRADKLIQGK